MRIELSPHKSTGEKRKLFTAKLIHESEPVAQITGAPHDIVTRWAEAMRDLHGGMPEIKRFGICHYCGGTERTDMFCTDCDRVFPIE